jgi:hypothetical protein
MNAWVRSRGRQAGLSSMEVLIAGFLGVVLTICGGYLFTTQVKGYSDIKEQARIQADMKKAMQVITRQISNAGACLPDPRKGFSAGHAKLSFRYVDVKRRFCASETDTLTMSFYAKAGSKGDYLVQEIRCPGSGAQMHTLFASPGGLDLTFNYQDKSGAATMDVGKIHAVELDLALRTTKAGGRPVRTREQVLRVNCPNLI